MKRNFRKYSSNSHNKKNSDISKYINERIKAMVEQTNLDIMELFKAHGINYVPFQLNYHQYYTVGSFNDDYDPNKTPYKNQAILDAEKRRRVAEQSGYDMGGGGIGSDSPSTHEGTQGTGTLAEKGDVFKLQKNISIDIDPKFFPAYFKEKVSYTLWLSRKYPKLQRESWWAMKNGYDPPHQYHVKRKEYENEMGVGNYQPEIQGAGFTKFSNFTKPTKHATMAGSIQSRPMEYNNYKGSKAFEGRKYWKAFTSADVRKFIENESFIFKGNMLTFFKSNQNEHIKGILKDVLTAFNEQLLSLDINTLDEQDPIEKQKQISKASEVHKKYIQNLEEFHTFWKPEPKFPNITNIRTWFLAKGIYKSYDFADFADKTTKQKANWIDRSVFLIANGIYAKALGQDLSKKYVGKAAYISKARKYKKFSKEREKYDTERKLKMELFRAETYTSARGWKNRYDRGATEKPKKDKNTRLDFRGNRR